MGKKKILLHSCCAPCSTAVIERLNDEFEITILYYNPNIYPEEEYVKRKNEEKRYIEILKEKGIEISMLDCDYESEKFYSAVKGLEAEREGGARCAVCFKLRLEETARKAKELGFDIFGTTLTVSPSVLMIEDVPGSPTGFTAYIATKETSFVKTIPSV